LVLGPETALSESFNEKESVTSYYQLLGKNLFKGNERLNLLIGASTYQIFRTKNSRASIPFEGGYYENYNASLYLSLKKTPEFIHKSKLVLGVEKIPFSNIFPFLETLAIQNGGTSGTLGVESEASIFQDKDFEGKGFGLAPVVCYESIYGAYLADQTKKGSNLICILTNDGWWGDSPGYKQHFSFSRLRAIENRRWVVRSANTGYSGVIDDYGTILKQTNYWEEAVFSNSVPLKYSTTFYVKWGDYLGVIGIGISLLLLLFSIYLRFKKAS
jgi:apolipoprotein N-acyltransferase